MLNTKKFLRIVIGVALSVLIGAGLMIFVYSLPTGRVVQNIQAGLQIYEREGNYPAWGSGEHSKLDNFTDAIMLLEVTHPIAAPVQAAMLNPRYGLPQDEKPVDALIKVMHGDTSDLTEINYPRYWHGYLVILKPMLMMAKVNHVRMLLAYTDFILFVVALLMFYKTFGNPHALAFAAAVMTINLVSVSMSFQFSSIYVVTLTALIIMLKKNRRLMDDELYPYFFAAIGIIVAFTDFLTYPVFSVGLPLIVFYLLNKDTSLKVMGGLLISWGVGYAGMWSGKWIAAYVLTGQNVLADGLHQIMVHARVVSDHADAGWQISFLSAIQRNIATLGHGPIRIFLFVGIIALLYVLISRRHLITRRIVLPYLFPAALPFVWYVMASGHSHIHAFFTYRGLAVTVFALACLAIELWQKKKPTQSACKNLRSC
ncbi:MAG: hypothetical protein IKI76_01890 [Selenomonadaceae bacterium]|nr:hypothetical protein [Selenomonadaceae bacterium]